jgi:hypothetical protein
MGVATDEPESRCLAHPPGNDTAAISRIGLAAIACTHGVTLLPSMSISQIPVKARRLA